MTTTESCARSSESAASTRFQSDEPAKARKSTTRDEVLYIPPLNFAQVSRNIFRSGYPSRKNFDFLKKKNIRCVIYLGKKSDELFHEQNLKFYSQMGIRYVHCDCGENVEPFQQMSQAAVHRSIRLALKPENQPVLLHCLKGKSQSACVVGCIRKIQKWPLSSIFDEYKRFSGKLYPLDLFFIELFDSAGFSAPEI